MSKDAFASAQVDKANGPRKAKAPHASVTKQTRKVHYSKFCHMDAAFDGCLAEKHLNSSEGKLYPLNAALFALP